MAVPHQWVAVDLPPTVNHTIDILTLQTLTDSFPTSHIPGSSNLTVRSRTQVVKWDIL